MNLLKRLFWRSTHMWNYSNSQSCVLIRVLNKNVIKVGSPHEQLISFEDIAGNQYVCTPNYFHGKTYTGTVRFTDCKL